MRIFEKNSKTNFVDDNNVFVGYDSDQLCCENFGWSITKNIPTTSNSNCLSTKVDLSGFNFDTTFFAENVLEDTRDGGSVTFKLFTLEEEVYLTLWNCHNGYYSHGFKMTAGAGTIQSGSI